jgi:uncharacterized protein
MRPSRRNRWLAFVSSLYLAVCSIGGIFVADGTLHPTRRPLTDDEISTARQSARALGSELSDASITAPDGAVLRAWIIHPHPSIGDDVILLHGMGDNRIGMTGYAQLLLAHGFTVLLPDARAHGRSGGPLATYGLLERNDIHQWFDFLAAQDHPRCIFALGESMGAAQLLQSLDTHANFCAVATESPFSNFREIAYDRMGQPFHLGPWFGRTILRPLVEVAFLRARLKYNLHMDQISPEDSGVATLVPVLVIHGQLDSNIPIRHSRQIHSRNPKIQLWEVPGAEHCGAAASAPQEFDRRLLDWFVPHGAGTLSSATATDNHPPPVHCFRNRPFCISCALPVDNPSTIRHKILHLAKIPLCFPVSSVVKAPSPARAPSPTSPQISPPSFSSTAPKILN